MYTILSPCFAYFFKKTFVKSWNSINIILPHIGDDKKDYLTIFFSKFQFIYTKFSLAKRFIPIYSKTIFKKIKFENFL